MSTVDWAEEGVTNLLVKHQWFQRYERDNSVAQRLAQGTQILPILQVDDQLSMEPVPGCVLNSLKISENYRN